MNRGKDNGRGAMPRSSSSSHSRTTTGDDAASSAEHRRKLEALFSGGSSAPMSSSRPQSSGSGERVFSSPRKSLGRSPSEYRLRLERLRIAREPEEIKEAADAFLMHHQLPDDMEILLKVLQHPSERVLRDAMGQISSLIIQGRAGNTLILSDRLGEIAGREVEASTRSYVDGLRNQLATLKK